MISNSFDLQRIERLLKIQHALDIYSIIAITDKHGTITYVNKEFCRISKYSENELIGQNHRILKSGHHLPEFYEGLWKTISAGHVWRGEVKNKAKDGSFYWVKTIIVPLLDNSNIPSEYVSIRTDITREKQLQEKLVESTDNLVKAERFSTIGELSSRLAHDIRNPVSIIKAEVDLFKLRNTPLDEQTLQSCQRIEKAITKITHRIEIVLDFVRTAPLHLETNSIRSIMDSAVSHLAIPAGIKIIFPKNDSTLVCDAQQLEVAIENIVTNSIQATENNGTITFNVDEKDNFVDIQIEDSGPGIPDDIIPKIFEPLFTTKQTGTGLGLASVKKIIDQHGGSITVKNNPTTFTITIPNGLAVSR